MARRARFLSSALTARVFPSPFEYEPAEEPAEPRRKGSNRSSGGAKSGGAAAAKTAVLSGRGGSKLNPGSKPPRPATDAANASGAGLSWEERMAAELARQRALFADIDENVKLSVVA